MGQARLAVAGVEVAPGAVQGAPFLCGHRVDLPSCRMGVFGARCKDGRIAGVVLRVDLRLCEWFVFVHPLGCLPVGRLVLLSKN